MSKRADLAKLLGKHYGTSAAGDDHLWAMADIVLDLLHPVIETYEELDALPVGSVVRDEFGDTAVRAYPDKDGWRCWSEIDYWDHSAEPLSAEWFNLPATVLHEGGAA